MSEKTRQFLIKVLHEDMNLSIDDDSLTPDLPLGSAGIGLESLDFIQLGMEADSELGVAVPDEDISVIASLTVGGFLDYLDQRLGLGDPSAPGTLGAPDTPDVPRMPPSTLRDVLAANTQVGITETTPLDEEFVLDSLALTWVLYVLKEHYGLAPDPEDPRLSGDTTIERIAGYANELRTRGQRDE